MFKISAVLLTPITFVAVAAIVSYPTITLGQTSPAPSEVNPRGCLSGYPNGTYQGDRSVTRNEFAARLNACLNQVERLISNRALATKADFQALIQRQRELNQ